MRYQIIDGTVSLGGQTVLSHIYFEIRGNEKIAVVGRNGAGKTTLLKLIAGELELDRDDHRMGPGITASRRLTIESLRQEAFSDLSRTVEEELLSGCPCKELYDRERFEYEREYDTLFTGLGFSKEDKGKPLSAFSGGEQTKIALIRLLLQKPDILLLDEPTNHLDMEAAEWLERYLKGYDKAVVMVSHDRFFLDQTADIIYELADHHLTRYPGSYTHYRAQKVKNLQQQQKAYERQQEEIDRLTKVIERFKHKPNKAAFARAKRKTIEKMEKIPKPAADDVHIFTGEITPNVRGNKWVFTSKRLLVGYDHPLLEITLRVKNGQKLGLIGPNGSGKSTFLKTLAGLLPALGGEWSLGNTITVGYFDQHSARLTSSLSVLEHFHNQFPALTEKEVRSILGAYLFGGRDCAKRVSDLSGGEKSRLVLAELLQSRPNFLILDEPTNHMDIQAKETLESAFRAYTGTILFVSHDRYFIRQIADSILLFENQSVLYYPFGYAHYLERKYRSNQENPAAQIKAEEEALIAGIRAVPKAERHRLREIPEEEAYLDWKLRWAGERLEKSRLRVEALWDKLTEQEETYWNALLARCAQDGQMDEDSGRGFQMLDAVRPDAARVQQCLEQYACLVSQYNQASEDWTAACLEWYEIAGEHPYLW